MRIIISRWREKTQKYNNNSKYNDIKPDNSVNIFRSVTKKRKNLPLFVKLRKIFFFCFKLQKIKKFSKKKTKSNDTKLDSIYIIRLSFVLLILGYLLLYLVEYSP